MRTLSIALCCVVLSRTSASADEFRVLARNVKSGDPRPDDLSEGSVPETIANQLKGLADYSIIGLSEVRPSAAKQFVDALSAGANETFLSIPSATGMDDGLVLAWRAKRLKLLADYELHRHGDLLLNSLDERGNWRHRSPLVEHFKDRETGLEFLSVTNHLAREGRGVRNRQSIGLRNWAAEKTLTVIAIGGFNVDTSSRRRRAMKPSGRLPRRTFGNGLGRWN